LGEKAEGRFVGFRHRGSFGFFGGLRKIRQKDGSEPAEIWAATYEIEIG